MFSIEGIEREIVEFFATKQGIIDILPGTPLCVYNIDEYDLIDLEIYMEEKHGITTDGEDCLCLSTEETLGEASEKMFNYLNKHISNE